MRQTKQQQNREESLSGTSHDDTTTQAPDDTKDQFSIKFEKNEKEYKKHTTNFQDAIDDYIQRCIEARAYIITDFDTIDEQELGRRERELIDTKEFLSTLLYLESCG